MRALYGISLGAHRHGVVLNKHGITPESAGIVKFVVVCFWALLTAAIFSAWHYIGPHGDPWDVRTFVFRWVCGLVFTFIYAFRGFAPAVWTHALYDIWVMTSMNQ